MIRELIRAAVASMGSKAAGWAVEQLRAFIPQSRQCWGRSVAVVCLGWAFSAYAMRWFFGVYAAMLPQDSFAADVLWQAWRSPGWTFAAASLIASFGAIVSLFRDMRADPGSVSLVNAVGHLIAGQFAGLITYFGCLEYELSWNLSMMICGVAGWGGNRTIEYINDRVINRLFPPADRL